MNAALFSTLVILFVLSVPVAVSIGLASVFSIHFFSHLPLLVVPQKMFAGLDSFPLLAIPFFILAGNLMSHGGVSYRLVHFAKSLVGNVQGGLASTAIITCMIFAAISGSSVATTFAVGAILIPAMVKQGYPVPMAATIQATSAELGVIIPPSVPMILYAVSTENSVRQMFIAGIGPGILIAIFLLIMVQIWCRLQGIGKQDTTPDLSFWQSSKQAFWALLLPILVIGGIYGGVFTPTEAAAVAAIYAFFVGCFIYKELSWHKLVHVLKVSATATSAIMLIIAAASLFSFLIGLSGIAQEISDWAKHTFEHKWSFLLFTNALLFVVGMFIETSAAILVLAPLLAPIAVSYGVDPIHFGIILIVNLAMGMITPPLGVNLFAAATIAQIHVTRMFKPLIIPVFTLLLALLCITYIPEISLYLRDLIVTPMSF